MRWILVSIGHKFECGSQLAGFLAVESEVGSEEFSLHLLASVNQHHLAFKLYGKPQHYEALTAKFSQFFQPELHQTLCNELTSLFITEECTILKGHRTDPIFAAAMKEIAQKFGALLKRHNIKYPAWVHGASDTFFWPSLCMALPVLNEFVPRKLNIVHWSVAFGSCEVFSEIFLE